MKFPVTIRYRSARVSILGKSDGFPYYRLSFSVAGKRQRQTFPTYEEALQAAKAKAKELHTGSQAGAFTAKQSRDALAALERLADHFRVTGERFSLLGAVSESVEARRKLGPRTLDQAVEGYLT